MSTADEISIKIAQAIESTNSACIYQSICICISEILSELRDCVCKLPSDGHSKELDTILLQLTNLCKILNSFNQDNWLQSILQFRVEELLTNLKEIMESIIGTLEKIDVKLTRKYDPSIVFINLDLREICIKLSDKTQPEIKLKLAEIKQYISRYDQPTQPIACIPNDQTTEKSESMDDINNLDLPNLSDNDIDDYKEEDMLDEVDERFDFQNVDKYQIQKSDYTQNLKPIFKNSYYSIYKGKMKLDKEKVTIMVLNKQNFDADKFKRFINVLTALKHPNLESFLGYVDSPLSYTVLTRRKGEKLTTILRRENGEEIESESEDEIDSENDKKSTKNDENEISLKSGYRTIIAFQIASTMSYLHSLKIAHCDLCTENITIDEQLNPQITNFAASQVIQDNIQCMSNLDGILTTKFVAPEINDFDGYNQKVDVFAFSGILYALLTNNKRPFPDIKNQDFEQLIRNNKRPTLPDNISTELKDLIESCWKQDPNDRPKFADIVQEMSDKSISFPQDKDSEVLKQFYASKKIGNDDLKTCLNLLKNIQEDNDIYVYKEEVARIRLLLSKYQYVLQSSDYLKQESIKDTNVSIQIKNMSVALENLWSTFKQIEKDAWLSISLNTPLFKIPNDFKQFMEDIYICLKSMNFKVPKYEQVDTDLMWDFRLIYSHFKNIKVSIEADLQKKEIKEFMEKKKFELTATQDEITELINNILSDLKNYELDKSDFTVKFSPFRIGSSGIVYEGIQNSSGKKVAVKKIEIKDLIEKDQLKPLQREIAALVQLKNEYLVHFVGFVNETGKYPWIITELVEGGDLWNANSNPKNTKKRKLNPFQKTKIAFEIAQGMEYLQSKGIINCDLKTSNILLDGDIASNNIKVKICNFGHEKITNTVDIMRIGTSICIAPEIIEGESYDFKTDVFSYGMILWELYAGERPSSEYSAGPITLDYPSSKCISADLKDLIENATNYQPSKRPSFTEIINIMLDEKIAFSGANPVEITSFYEQKAQEINEYRNVKTNLFDKTEHVNCISCHDKIEDKNDIVYISGSRYHRDCVKCAICDKKLKLNENFEDEFEYVFPDFFICKKDFAEYEKTKKLKPDVLADYKDKMIKNMIKEMFTPILFKDDEIKDNYPNDEIFLEPDMIENSYLLSKNFEYFVPTVTFHFSCSTSEIKIKEFFKMLPKEMIITYIEKGSTIITIAIILSKEIPQIEQSYSKIIELLKSSLNTPYGKTIVGNLLNNEPEIEFPEKEKITEFLNDKSINILQNADVLNQIDIELIKGEIQEILKKQKDKNLEFIFNNFYLFEEIGKKIHEDVKINDIEFIVIGKTLIANDYYKKYKEIKDTINEDDQVECFLYHGTQLCNQPKIIRNHFLNPAEDEIVKTTDDGYFGKGIYATDNIFYASVYSNDVTQLGFNDKISVLGCIAIYNAEYEKFIEDLTQCGLGLPEDVIKNNGIHYGLVGSKGDFYPINENEKDKYYIVANEYVFPNKYQIIPLCSITIMRTQYYILWADESAKYSKHYNQLKEQIKENIYYVNSIQDALDFASKKKRNLVKLIISFDNDDYANNIIDGFREVYKSDIVCLIYAENSNNAEFVKSKENVLFTNEMSSLNIFADIEMTKQNILQFSSDISKRQNLKFNIDDSTIVKFNAQKFIDKTNKKK